MIFSFENYNYLTYKVLKRGKIQIHFKTTLTKLKQFFKKKLSTLLTFIENIKKLYHNT